MNTSRVQLSWQKFFALAMLGVLIAGCEKAAPPAPPPPIVEIMALSPRDVPIQREWVGVTDGDINATIRPQVTGYLVKQNYREGEFVKKGQVLFEIDSRTFKTNVEQARAVRNQQKAIHSNALATLERVRPLAAKNALSQKDLDDAVGKELSSRSSLEQASAALDAASLNLGFTRIVSPIDGIAGIAKAQIGDLLSPSAQNELTTISTVNPIKVNINFSEREYLAFEADRDRMRAVDIPLELILVDGSVYPHQGQFSLLDRQVDANTGTFKITTRFPNPDALLRPGQFAKLRATITIRKDALLVPQRAVTELQGRYLIGVVGEGNKVEIRPVKVGERIGSEWIITEGVQSGEKIIVEGTMKVRPGIVVNPQPFNPEKAHKPSGDKAAKGASDAKDAKGVKDVKSAQDSAAPPTAEATKPPAEVEKPVTELEKNAATETAKPIAETDKPDSEAAKPAANAVTPVTPPKKPAAKAKKPTPSGEKG